MLVSVLVAAPAAGLSNPGGPSNPGVPSNPGGGATTMAVRGVDVSSYQHQGRAAINWAGLKRAGYRFVAVKATEGTYYFNPYYRSDVAAATRAGLNVIPYVFANPHDSGGASEAAYAVMRSGYRWSGRMLPLVVDMEPDPYTRQDHTNACYGLARPKMVAWIAAFAARTKAQTGHAPLIYTSASWWGKCTGNSSAFRADPLWVADYGTHQPNLPPAWSKWTFWQYADGAQIKGAGYKGRVDLDYGPGRLTALLRPSSHRHRPGRLGRRGHRRPSVYEHQTLMSHHAHRHRNARRLSGPVHDPGKFGAIYDPNSPGSRVVLPPRRDHGSLGVIYALFDP
jgi:GH25 family lysozyme M1 (1,4-beta-N-acetylmuramidase)